VIIKIAIAVVSSALVMNLCAVEKQFAIEKAGFLGDSNRWTLAKFSKATLTVGEHDGKFKLPCRFSFVPQLGKDGCAEINFSSTLVESSRKNGGHPKRVMEKATACNAFPFPKLLQIDTLVFDVSEYPLDVDIIAKQGGGSGGSLDMVLYQKVPEKYYRFLCSNETGSDYWWVLMLGKRVEYRIWPVCCEGDEYIVEYSDIKSRYFSKMTLIYARYGHSFRLRNVIIAGDYSYKGAPLKRDPATDEIRRDFFESRSHLCENYVNGIVETGCGVLRSQKKVKYTVYEKTANERFKIVIEICED